jgi:anti-sigma factor RsiW
MNCEWWRETLSALLDDETTPAESVAVEAHLTGCGICRDRFERNAEMTSKVRDLINEPGPRLYELVLSTVDGTREPAVAGTYRLTLAPPPTGLLPLRVVGRPLRAVGSSPCGCAASCRCGCQAGAPCRCGSLAA